MNLTNAIISALIIIVTAGAMILATMRVRNCPNFIINPLIFHIMNIQTIIGNIGHAAETKNKDGQEFTTFRVAVNDSWTDANGTKHDNTQWIDCVMNGRPNVAQYLQQGTQVCVVGRPKYRIYSSEKDRCMKAGVTLNVIQVELIGGVSDAVPRRLYTLDGRMLDTQKYYWCSEPNANLIDQRGRHYITNEGGWIAAINENGEVVNANVLGSGDDSSADDAVNATEGVKKNPSANAQDNAVNSTANGKGKKAKS